MPARPCNGEGSALRYRWIVYLVAIAAIAMGSSKGFGLDDAYITLHNARALIEGADATYGVHPLTGATSQLHLALLALAGLIMPLPLASIILGVGAAISYAIALDAAVRKTGLEGWHVPTLVGVGLLIGTVPIHLLNGLETGLAMAAVAGLLALADNRRWLPVLAGLAPFIRPELGLLSGLLLVRQHSLRGILVAGIIATPWIAWEFLSTGHLVPSTMAAKLAFFAGQDVTFGMRVIAVVYSFGAAWFVPLLVGLTSARAWPASVFVAIVVAAAAVLIPGSLSWNDSRYLAPLVPALIVGVASLNSASFRAPFIMVLAVWSLVGLPRFYMEMQSARTANGAQVEQFRAIALPPGTKVLIHDAGEIAWAAPQLRLVDVVGLKTPVSADFHRRYTRNACGWSAALDAIARESGAEYAVVLQAPFWECVGTNLEQAGWKLEPQWNPDSRYQLFRLTPPGAVEALGSGS